MPRKWPGSIFVYITDVTYAGEWIDGEFWCAQIQLIGRRQTHESVVVRVGGFLPYFYCSRNTRSPEDQQRDDVDMQEDLEGFLSRQADEMDRPGFVLPSGKPPFPGASRKLRCTFVQVSSTSGIPAMGYQPARGLFKVETSHPDSIAKLRDYIVQGKCLPHLTVGEDAKAHTYDANVEYVIRFMVDHSVRCHSWIEVNPSAEVWDDSSYCTSPDLYAEDPSLIHALSEKDEEELDLKFWLKLMSFDIETASKLGAFSDPNKDPVLQIACDFCVLDGRPNNEVEANATAVLLALNKDPSDADSSDEDLETDASTVGENVDVRCFKTEAELLLDFAALVRERDVDIITGWNTPNFDWHYIITRCAALGLPDRATHFSRLHNRKTGNRAIKAATKAHGHKDDNEVNVPGRVIFDMLDPVRVNYKYRSYKLDDVAQILLNERKDDLSYSEIMPKWRGTPQDRGLLGKYCVQDARLPRRLLLITFLLIQYLEIARVQRVPTSYLVTKGQQVRVYTMILYAARQAGMVINYAPRTDEENRKGAVALQEVTYQGATVVEPLRGFYTEPVATLDFASLYPSIMLADNNSHDTWLASGKLPSGRSVKRALAERNETSSSASAASSSSSSSSSSAAAAAAAAATATATASAKPKEGKQEVSDATLGDDDSFDYDDDAPEVEEFLQPPEIAVPQNYESGNAELTDDDIVITPTGDLFVKESVRRGLLPTILNELLSQRRVAKRKMAEAEEAGDMHMKMVYDKRQLALKVSANSVYGFCGVKFGRLPCKPIARSVTARGREMIEMTKKVVVDYYAKHFAPKYGGKAIIVYGDTDSVFVKFPCTIPQGADGKLTDVSAAIQESFVFAEACSRRASEVFQAPNKLEVEKAYCPFLIVKKKRYAGGYFEYRENKLPGSTPEKIATSGLETVRRDNAKMLPRQMQAVLDALMYDLSSERAIQYAQDAVAAIVHGPVEAVTIAETFVTYSQTCMREAGCDEASVAEIAEELEAVVMSSYTGAAAEINAIPISPHSKQSEWLEVIDAALKKHGLEQHVDLIRERLCRYMRYNLTPDDFVVSQKYGRPFNLYTDKQPHIEMLKRMEKRGKTGKDTYAASYRKYLGDRVDFIIAGPSAYYKDVGVTDRAEDPKWAELNGVVPDPVYYLGQILRPLARILSPLEGKKSAAYHKIMAIQSQRPRPDIGFVIGRFDSKTQLRIWKHYATGAQKRYRSPAAQLIFEEKKALAQYQKDVAAALEMGMAPPSAPKRKRVSGPMDAFFSAAPAASASASSKQIVPRSTSARTGATPAQLQRRKERIRDKAIADARRLAEGTDLEYVAPVEAPVIGAMDIFFATGSSAASAAAALATVASAASTTVASVNVLIQSEDTDDIEKGIKHGVWASLSGYIDVDGNKRGNLALTDYFTKTDGNVWLYFTKYGTGKIFAVGRMQSLPDGPRMSYWDKPSKYGSAFKVDFIHTSPIDMPEDMARGRLRDTEKIQDEHAREIMKQVMASAPADTPFLKLARLQVLR